MSSIDLYRFPTVRHIQNKNRGFSALVPMVSVAKPRKNLPGPINPGDHSRMPQINPLQLAFLCSPRNPGASNLPK